MSFFVWLVVLSVLFGLVIVIGLVVLASWLTEEEPDPPERPWL